MPAQRQTPAAAWLLLVLLAAQTKACTGALNVGIDAVSGLADELRQFIFVDVAYLTERPKTRCSSLDGPACFRLLTEGAEPSGRGLLDGPGLLPDALLHDFGGEGSPVELNMPFHGINQLLNQAREASSKNSPQGLISAAEIQGLQGSREERVNQGVLHFGGLQPDRRVPLSFSRGLPPQVIATWDGKWIARHCSGALQGESSDAVALLAPPAGAVGALPPGMSSSGVASSIIIPDSTYADGLADGQSSRTMDGVTVELAGSLGYLRFSQPVVVRSMFARWAFEHLPSTPAIIAGRRGTDAVWSTFLDPRRGAHSDWLDVTGGSLEPVDEILIVGSGLELGAMWVVAGSSNSESGSDARDDDSNIAALGRPLTGRKDKQGAAPDNRSVLMLTPVANQAKAAEQPALTLSMQRLAPEAMPFIMSLQEAAEKGLRLQVDPKHWSLPHSRGSAIHYPGMISTALPMEQWSKMALGSQMLMQHDSLATWMAAGLSNSNGDPQALAGSVVRVLEHAAGVPTDLQRRISQDRSEYVQALRSVGEEHLQKAESKLEGLLQGLHPNALPTPSPNRDEHKARLARAQLDVLAVAMLHAQAWSGSGQSWPLNLSR